MARCPPRLPQRSSQARGGMRQKPLSLDKEGQGHSLNSESPWYAFLACPADLRCQRPPGAQGAPPHPASCLCLASTPRGPVVQRCDPRDAQNIHQESQPSPGRPEDLQSPGEGCGSGENVYKKPRQDWTEPQ
ncbi:unnamed protein product [Rangifer tarandus platyrhynchus]|uniref:Uncharacterized protein n=1 Tax=Rangifer tarandus platyrhynchus TaxID=3082113 RepID=A0AC59Z5T6_RANTA